MGEVEFYPFDRVVFPRKQKDQGAEVIRPEDLKIILNYLKENDPQLYLASMVEFYCFIRPGRELRLLRVSDIDCDRGIITIRQENAKNKTKQTVTMPNQLIELCREFGVDTAPKEYFVFGKKGKIRGLLCNKCNMGLGFFKDDIELLRIAISYLNGNNN